MHRPVRSSSVLSDRALDPHAIALQRLTRAHHGPAPALVGQSRGAKRSVAVSRGERRRRSAIRARSGRGSFEVAPRDRAHCVVRSAVRATSLDRIQSSHSLFVATRDAELDERGPTSSRRGERRTGARGGSRAGARERRRAHAPQVRIAGREPRVARLNGARLCRSTLQRTGVSQPRASSASPRAIAKKRSCSVFVIGPRAPVPTVMPSTDRIGVTSATVPVKKASEAV